MIRCPAPCRAFRFGLYLLSIVPLAFAVACGGKSDKPEAQSAKPGAQSQPAASSAASGRKQLQFAFVVNNPSTFWSIAEKGVRKAEKEFGVKVDFRTPPSGAIDEQQQIIQDLIAKKMDGMAISPIDPANMTTLLNEAAQRMILITHDSDAPASNRRAYIGTNNYEAGKIAGEEIKKALPNGGDIIIFVGRLDAQNAQDRQKGIVDVLAGTKIKVIDTRLDHGDQAKAKENVEGMIVAHPDIAGFTGLWSYNGPAIVSAVQAAGKVGKIKIIAFDEEPGTLQGIKDGAIESTVVQKPFEFGYQSVRLLTEVANGNSARIPASKLIDTGVLVVNKQNVDEFSTELKRLQQ